MIIFIRYLFLFQPFFARPPLLLFLGQSECSRGFLKMERSCIGIEQEIKVSKEEAERTCKSANKMAKLATLTKEEVKFVKEVTKTGEIYDWSRCEFVNTLISGTLGKQRFFVNKVMDGEWESTNNDILLIQDEGKGQDDYTGENSKDSRKQNPHFFICKYQLQEKH